MVIIMASDIWCQNPMCVQKKTNAQIRGSKGNKYYQSKKAVDYLGYWCSHSCREKWFDLNREVCVQAVGMIGKKTIPLKDAWYVEYSYGHYRWNNESNQGGYINQGFHLINKLQGVDRLITKEQAQSPEQIADGHTWKTIDDEKAKELAVSLGLAS
jgi:hypothetical protein